MSLESRIENSYLYNILTSNNQTELQSKIEWDEDLILMATKIAAIISCKKKGYLNDVDIRVVSDRKMITSLFNGNVDVDRLKTLMGIEIETSEGTTRSDRELITEDYITHERMMELMDTFINDTQAVECVRVDSPTRIEAVPFIENLEDPYEEDDEYDEYDPYEEDEEDEQNLIDNVRTLANIDFIISSIETHPDYTDEYRDNIMSSYINFKNIINSLDDLSRTDIRRLADQLRVNQLTYVTENFVDDETTLEALNFIISEYERVTVYDMSVYLRAYRNFRENISSLHSVIRSHILRKAYVLRY